MMGQAGEITTRGLYLCLMQKITKGMVNERERKKGKSEKLLERIFPCDDCGSVGADTVCCYFCAGILAGGVYGIHLSVDGDYEYSDYARSCE